MSRSSEGGGGGRRSLWTCKKIIEGCLSRLLPALYLGPSVRPPSSLSSYPSFQFPRQPARSSGSDSFPDKKKKANTLVVACPGSKVCAYWALHHAVLACTRLEPAEEERRLERKKKLWVQGIITRRALWVARQWCLAAFSRLATLKVRSRHPWNISVHSNAHGA